MRSVRNSGLSRGSRRRSRRSACGWLGHREFLQIRSLHVDKSQRRAVEHETTSIFAELGFQRLYVSLPDSNSNSRLVEANNLNIEIRQEIVKIFADQPHGIERVRVAKTHERAHERRR